MAKAPKKTRAHIPALNPARLELAVQALNALPISTAGKRAVENSLRTAANPEAEAPEQVVKSLDRERRQRIRDAEAGYAAIFSAPARRGKAALQAMSDEEWQKAVDDQASQQAEDK